MAARNRGGVICRSFQTKEGTRARNACAKSAQVPISSVSCWLTENRITCPSILKPGGGSAISHSMVRGWITSYANFGADVRTVKRSLNSSLSKRTFSPPQPPSMDSIGSENGRLTAVTTSEWFSVTVRVRDRPSESV